jgi:hypothetical protein
VVGVPGDRYERKRGVFYLNGKPVPRKLKPLATWALWDDLVFERVPEDKFLVIIGHASSERGLFGSNLLGGSSPRFEGYIVKGWEEACLISKDQIFGRCPCIYWPPPRREWLSPSRKEVEPFIPLE